MANTLNHIARILPLANVILDLSVSSKKRVFEQVGIIIENNHGIARAIVSDSLFERERLGSTGLGYGVAVPHGRIKGLKAPLAAFVRLLEPVPFEAPDSVPVNLLMFLLIPQDVMQSHLDLLSEVAEMFADENFRTVLATKDLAQVHHHLVTWQSMYKDVGARRAPNQQAAS